MGGGGVGVWGCGNVCGWEYVCVCVFGVCLCVFGVAVSCCGASDVWRSQVIGGAAWYLLWRGIFPARRAFKFKLSFQIIPILWRAIPQVVSEAPGCARIKCRPRTEVLHDPRGRHGSPQQPQSSSQVPLR